MIQLIRNVLSDTIDRLSSQFSTYTPGLLAAVLIVFVAYLLAVLARWLLFRIFKGIAFDRFLRQSGLLSMVNRSCSLRAVEIVAHASFWLILLGGVLTGIRAFNTELTYRVTETVMLLSPKLLAAGGILLAGFWLGRHLGSHFLVWAVNEGIPSARKLAVAVRVLVVFIAVAVAADYLDFARNVFLAAFILIVGGLVLAASLALGLCGKEILQRRLQEKPDSSPEKEEMPLWRHL